MAETLSSLQDLANINASVQPDAPVHVQKLDAQGRAYATGKRKDAVADRKSTRLNSSHSGESRMPSSA